MHVTRLICPVAVLLFSLSWTCLGDTVSVSGTVTDAAGKAMSNMEVAAAWTLEKNRLKPVGKPLRTNSRGAFSGELTVEGNTPIALLAVDLSRQRGGVLLVQPEVLQQAAPLSLQAHRLVEVRGKLNAALIRPAPKLVRLDVTLANALVLRVDVQRQFNLKLPPGEYDLWLGGDGIERQRRVVAVGASSRPIQLDPFDLRPAPVGGEVAGPRETPPLTVSDARGVAPSVRLTDYRGKWVLLEFWGYWCAPCVRGAIPELMAFDDKHQPHKDKYQILTFHYDRTKNSFEALDPELAKLSRAHWKDRAFPFPILLDSSGRTPRDWGVRGYPTAFLINPDGALVRQGTGVAEISEIEAYLSQQLTGAIAEPVVTPAP